MTFEEILEEFGRVAGKLKTAYAEEFCGNSSYVSIFVDDDNCVTIIPTIDTANGLDGVIRQWVDDGLE